MIRKENGVSKISTHALREEGDLGFVVKSIDPKHISTHALREEGDGLCRLLHRPHVGFLPTPSARRATCRVL